MLKNNFYQVCNLGFFDERKKTVFLLFYGIPLLEHWLLKVKQTFQQMPKTELLKSTILGTAASIASPLSLHGRPGRFRAARLAKAKQPRQRRRIQQDATFHEAQNSMLHLIVLKTPLQIFYFAEQHKKN